MLPDNLIAGFIRYDLCKTCETDNNHQRDSCINCRTKSWDEKGGQLAGFDIFQEENHFWELLMTPV